MPMSKLHAWTIFKSATLQKEEGLNAIAALMDEDAEAYWAHGADLDLELSQAIIEVQNEGADLLNGHSVQHRLESVPAYAYTAADYRDLVTVFEGSLYEKLHLSAFFRINNSELLFDLVKPTA